MQNDKKRSIVGVFLCFLMRILFYWREIHKFVS